MQESEEEKRERIHLIRELKISELMLNSKKNELENENKKNTQLQKEIENLNKNNEIQKEIDLLKSQLEKQNLNNKKIEFEIQKKTKISEELYQKLAEGKSKPVNEIISGVVEGDEEDENKEEDKYDYI